MSHFFALMLFANYRNIGVWIAEEDPPWFTKVITAKLVEM